MSTQKWYDGLTYQLSKAYSLKKIRFDWSDWLNEIGVDTLSTASVVLETGLVASNENEQSTYVEYDFSCPAATVGDTLKATCVIDTAGGQSEPRHIYFEIID